VYSVHVRTGIARSRILILRVCMDFVIFENNNIVLRISGLIHT
jgi:hypothetical protein